MESTPSACDNNNPKSCGDDNQRKWCRREKNRIHARNSRERKKNQVEMMQLRIEHLRNERNALAINVVDASVAEILMTLSSEKGQADKDSQRQSDEDHYSSPSSINTDRKDAICSDNKAKIGTSVISETVTDQDSPESVESVSSECESDLEQTKKTDRTQNIEDIDALRRERNRLHARTARRRKKLMIEEMETVINKLEKEVTELKMKEQILYKVKLETQGYDLSSTSDTQSSKSEPTTSDCSTLDGATESDGRSSGDKKRKRRDESNPHTDTVSSTPRNHHFPQLQPLYSSNPSNTHGNQFYVNERGHSFSQLDYAFPSPYDLGESRSGTSSQSGTSSGSSSEESMDELYVEAYSLLARGLEI
mmetsp:Transcript_12039/g.12103  ORF Transcript_12039/g.12103 Transcript_12039/m.12103 type:complete len:364 (-) Transcript_12039:404-1495(-)|eukprot:CAMPEP_0182429082 /NCGR_PEP_ID=MMETSP1167-20130531/25503_1 /TAXON_ID=2988 /ORGANISM="Mallomonas Sp, Strain CCMP3275" /LENGTH=363 /DNA_ID=CAMNT_0024612409 /DNA_START=109 /DNA_END=1200 /DNA_ORIENTATION=+